MKFSLILPTIGRVEEIGRFLQSLSTQTYKDFEVIIVDQNEDSRLNFIVGKYKNSINIIHLKSQKRGLSRARNYGLESVSGDVIAFPDDDCWYPNDLLENVYKWFLQNESIDALSTRVVDENGNTTVTRFDSEHGLITIYNVWRRSTSISLFVKNYVVEKVGGFDELIGVGSGTKWGAGEDIDYPIRAIKKGFMFYYLPNLTVNHPRIIQGYSREILEKVYSYACGTGYVVKKHKYSFLYKGYILLRPLGGVLQSILTFKFQKSMYHVNILKGRLRGLL